jgi:hypothetical protein
MQTLDGTGSALGSAGLGRANVQPRSETLDVRRAVSKMLVQRR